MNCILEDGHRNHPVDPIANAHSREKEKLSKILSMTDKMYTTTHDKLARLEEVQRQAQSHYEETDLHVDKFFAELRRILTVEEDAIKQKVREALATFEGKCKEREARLTDQLDGLNQLVELIGRCDGLDNVDFLQGIRERDELLEKVVLG